MAGKPDAAAPAEEHLCVGDIAADAVVLRRDDQPHRPRSNEGSQAAKLLAVGLPSARRAKGIDERHFSPRHAESLGILIARLKLRSRTATSVPCQ